MSFAVAMSNCADAKQGAKINKENTMNIAVFGACGKVGRKVCQVAKQRGHTVFAIEKSTPLPNVNVDAVIDFSIPTATQQVCDFCKTHHCALISGVTGRSEEQQRLLCELQKTNAVCTSSNFSQGMPTVEQLCKACAALGWDCAITETHRKGKLDAPSGTAKKLAAIIAQNGTPIVETHSLRLGDTVGTHQIIFSGTGESICITHNVQNATCFALGAVKTAEKLAEKC